MAAYGSRIAGYSKGQSDLDLLVVLREYPPKVRYKYLKGKIDLSALLVDRDSLVADAERAYLGEFVVGRLLNTYQPIEGEEFLSDVENRFKGRVILETLVELASQYGEFANNLLIPPDYFLFEKLRKRSSQYPPALYSYIRTYTGPRSPENVIAAKKGFEYYLRKLATENFLDFNDGFAHLKKGAVKGGQLVRLSNLITTTKRGATSYLVHGWAGRVSFDVVRRESMSKLRRSRESGSPPSTLSTPKNLLRIPEGELLIEEKDWSAQLPKILKLGSKAKIRKQRLGEIYSPTWIYTLKERRREDRVVVKKFRDVWSPKWALTYVWAIPSKRLSMTPLERLSREYFGLGMLRKHGFMTPEVVAVQLSHRILMRKFIDGVTLDEIASDIVNERIDGAEAVAHFGEILSRIHSLGMSFGDTKPNNYVINNKDDKIYLLNLEQLSEGGDQAWDIAEFLYYSVKLAVNSKGPRALADAFREGYLKHGSADKLQRAARLKYLLPFQPFLFPPVINEIRRQLQSSR
ncbi:hypothetical protein CL673_07145 [Candidatus Bathyarchaeota archaeon]|nr:hypothetical protein [Candidatus Bathyarchaeota archaeon]